MSTPLFFPADAHEGPVWVPHQARLYFATATHLDSNRRVSIHYLDLSKFGRPGMPNFWANLPAEAPTTCPPQAYIHDANMANGMVLTADGSSLLVAEQGNEQQPSAVSKINLSTQHRTVLLDNFRGQPFNSLNKAIRSKAGHLILSDPDYGFRQGFRPPPVLEPNLYVHNNQGATQCFRCHLQMPHGLALSPDESTLFVSDTSNEGAHRNTEISLGRRKSVWAFSFAAEEGIISGTGRCCFAVDHGVPDGMVTTQEYLLVGGGDGVYVADLKGRLLGKIPTPNTAVNLALVSNDRHLFVTVEDGVLLLRNWEEQVRPIA